MKHIKNSAHKKRGDENIIHFWRHENSTDQNVRTAITFMQSKVDYFFILSPLSVKIGVF